jgi:hypothetical protein
MSYELRIKCVSEKECEALKKAALNCVEGYRTILGYPSFAETTDPSSFQELDLVEEAFAHAKTYEVLPP